MPSDRLTDLMRSPIVHRHSGECERRDKNSGWRGVSGVYVIACEGFGLYKIGMARDVGKRLMFLQGSSPFPLRVIAVADGKRALERRLHHQFFPHWVRGEWFQFDEDELGRALDLIGTLAPRMDPRPQHHHRTHALVATSARKGEGA
jgi:hypothetical protein